jgi:hypothetical protein
MSTDIPTDNIQGSTDGAKVIDEENRVDKRLKDRILDARERVAESENEIFIGAPLDKGVNLTSQQLVQLWATAVRQFLRTIEPLLQSDEIEKSQYYYREIPILKDELYPPDGKTKVTVGDDVTTEGIEWSLFYNDNVDTLNLIKDPSFEPPDPKTVEIRGLKDVIETEVISCEWSVVMNPSMHFSKPTKVAHPSVRRPLSKPTLEFAVRKADQFLQDAGVGLEIGAENKEAESDYSDIVDVDSLE